MTTVRNVILSGALAPRRISTIVSETLAVAQGVIAKMWLS